MAIHFGWAVPSVAGVSVTETSALGLSAFYRAGAVISGSIASLPLRSLRTTSDDRREPVASWVDDPAGPDSLTPYEFKEQCVWHLFLQGDAFLMHRFNGAGALVGLHPVHPLAVGVQWDKTRPGGKLYRVTLVDGTYLELDATTMTQVMGPSLDGLRGMSVITLARNSLGTAIAGDRAAGNMFANGGMLSGIITPEEDVEPDEVTAIKADVNANMTGSENAGKIAVVNRKLKFTPWSMNAADAQFLETREFSIEEVARWTGVPANLLMKSDAVSTWGTGVEIVNRGLRQYTLASYTGRFEQRLSRLLPRTQLVEFDFAGLERPTPEQEIDLLIKQVDAGLLTPNEARRIRNLPPLDGGDVPRTVGQSPTTELPQGVQSGEEAAA
jgi:HK97 family phage portal protein